MLRIAVFVSGRGSNLKAIFDSIPDYMKNVKIQFVVSNKIACGALDFAEKNNIATFSISENKETESANNKLINYSKLKDEFEKSKIDLIVLAGFLKKIPDFFVQFYENRIINIHPALLPAFGGKGMYGMNVHKAVFKASAQVSGPTVHFVNTVYDTGKIIAQKAVDISDVNSPEEIAERVLKIEHQILPMVIKKISENKLIFKNNRVYLID